MTFSKLDTSRAFTKAITANRKFQAKAASDEADADADVEKKASTTVEVDVDIDIEAAKLQKVNLRNRKLICYKGTDLTKLQPTL